MVLVKHAAKVRHHVTLHMKQRKRWIHVAFLILAVYMCFIWVATKSITTNTNNNVAIMNDVSGNTDEEEEEGDGEGDAEDEEEDGNSKQEELDNNNAAVAAVVGAAAAANANASWMDRRCAICFFGLPRSFASMVLPSLTRNVFLKNARYGCDYFIHYYHRDMEPGGRAGEGGKLNPDEVLLMKQRIKGAAKRAKQTHNREPIVIFVKDTEEEFWQKRGALVEKYRTTKDTNGNYLYYPWKAVTYHYPESLDNIVKQWYVINTVFVFPFLLS